MCESGDHSWMEEDLYNVHAHRLAHSLQTCDSEESI